VCGALALAFIAAHAAVRLARGEATSLLWSCNVGNLVLGIGLLLGQPRIVAIMALWIAIGLPLWVLDLFSTDDFVATSVLTHVGGLTVAIVGVRELGFPRGSWWRAHVALTALQQVSRLVTPASENVNLSGGVYEPWKPYFHSYPVYYVLASAGICFGFFLVETVGLWLMAGESVEERRSAAWPSDEQTAPKS
jgi:hypothetical protein